MFIVLLALFANVLLSVLGGMAVQLAGERDDMASEVQADDVAIVGQALDGYFKQNAAFPASLSALASTPGFEYTNAFAQDTSRYGYQLAAGVDDGKNVFDRAAVFALDTRIGQTPAQYVAANTACGTSFAVAEAWCGTAAIAPWSRLEGRNYINGEDAMQYARQARATKKIARYFHANPSFPAMSTNPDSLAHLVGYGGTAKNCGGTFVLWGKVQLDCADLFSIWGAPVYVQMVSGTHLQLYASSPKSMQQSPAPGTPYQPTTDLTVP
ncbi:hypothetical protein [Noviherbaspirillum pedocola]|uniref:Uncharacterized protein n=1 Tax=Noviherbaspirillum pedocola TaxID=2801341 RepID=A0A934SY84_9BURK|nr:hypothetical protein [Noviherbaspirillum pedocola]MBK4738750.1 hypothetical protein [Noviherbaspirillum pedocola]